MEFIHDKEIKEERNAKIMVYSVFDKKAGKYGQPFFTGNDAMAERMLQSAVKEKNLIGQYPEDFRLDKIAEYDEKNGEFVNDSKIIAEAIKFKEV